MNTPRIIHTISLGDIPLAQALEITTATLTSLRNIFRATTGPAGRDRAHLIDAMLTDLTSIATHARVSKLQRPPFP